ncbi:hypothetical protein M9H77_31298 [Catharanthus roseus]|uniref:Uncharacterized protein n=1 Tax=Catharanthus roseus TaxID=4058 RepID=A0ACC0A0M7_CATRO|nr:hypothetical protein M9H77_31298 [Catharanthus roseus]
MLNWLQRELGKVISHYPDRNHNGLKVTFILVHLCFAAQYCHREKVSFMTFSTLLHTYLKMFEADGLYTLYYERFFQVTHALQVTSRFSWDSECLVLSNYNMIYGPFSKWFCRELSGFICRRPDFTIMGAT